MEARRYRDSMSGEPETRWLERISTRQVHRVKRATIRGQAILARDYTARRAITFFVCPRWRAAVASQLV